MFKRKIKRPNYYKKPFYIKMAYFPFKKNDIIRAGGQCEYIVIDDCCKDQWWKKVLRDFWIPIPNRSDCIKVKWYRNLPLNLIIKDPIKISG